MESLLRLLGACSSHGLLTAQLLFSVTFVSSCELPNWLVGPREVNGCLERWMTVSALFFPSGLRGSTGANGATGAVLPSSRRGLFR